MTEPNKPPRPPPPAPETLQGIGSGIREILLTVNDLGSKYDRLETAVGRVEFQQNQQGYEIHAIKREQDVMKNTLADHGDRIVDLERHPHARPVMTATGASIPPLESLPRSPHKSGSFPAEVIQEAWAEVEKTVAAMGVKLTAMEQENAIAAKLAEDAEKREKLADARSTRLRGWLTLTVITLVALAGLFAYLAPRLGR